MFMHRQEKSLVSCGGLDLIDIFIEETSETSFGYSI